MKRILLSIGILALLASCKPSEANYRQAYERTMQGREAEAAADSTIYTQIRREMKQGSITVDGATLPVNTQYVAITEGGGGIAENIRRYCVVAGQFKQIFNAKSMRERLVENGYPAAFVVQTREPYYYVVAASYDDIKPAAEMLERLSKDSGLKIKKPLPFILNPAQIK